MTAEGRISNLFIYEYIWALSVSVPLDEKERPIHDWIDKLKKTDTIIVQIFFHTTNTKYSVRALTGTLKPPIMTKKSFADAFWDSWMKMTGTAAKLIGATTKVYGIEQLGMAMDMASELEKDVIPSSHAYPWYLKTIMTEDIDNNPLYGMEWTINRRAFYSIGNCLMGGAGLIFIKSSDLITKKDYIKLDVRARIAYKEPIFNKGNYCDVWIPEDPNIKDNFRNKVLFLKIFPKNSR